MFVRWLWVRGVELRVYVWVHLFSEFNSTLSPSIVNTERCFFLRFRFWCRLIFSLRRFFSTATIFFFFGSLRHPASEISLFANAGEKWSTPKQLCLFTACGRHFRRCVFFFSMPFFWRSKGEEQGGNLLAAFKHTFDWELPIERVLSAKTCRRGYKKDGYPILENRHVLLIGWWLGSWPYFHGVIVAVNTKMAHDL